ncbi:MAG: translocation/assembly module TamB domain-containing protein [Flavobacteriales bacterium]
MPSLPMEQPTSPPISTAPRLRRAKWMVGVIAGVLIGLVAGRDVWLPRAISWALPRHLNATLDEVKTSLFPPALLVRGFHLADTTSGWDVEVSYVEAAGIAWQAGRLHVASLQLDSVACAADVARGAGTSGASSLDLGVDALRWNHLHVATANDTVAWKHGMALKLELRPHQRSVDRLSWDTCRWNAPALPQELVLGPSSLSIQDDVEGWQVSSNEVQLPGVRFSGALGWPLRATHGQARVDWNQVPAWMLEHAGLASFEPCWEAPQSAPSWLTWSVTPDAWELTGQGPCGLTLTAGGDPTMWSAQARVDQLPSAWEDAVGTDVCTVQIEGRDSAFTWSADALPALAAHGEGQLTMPTMNLQLQASISTLGGWIHEDHESLTAKLALHKALDWELAQPGVAHPWRLSGQADSQGTSFRFNDTVQGQATWAPDAPAPLQVEAHLGEGPQRVNVEASYAHDEGEVTLDLLAAHTEGHLTADIAGVDWQTWWSSVTSRTQTVWPILRGSGGVTHDSPCWAWMGEQASAQVTWDLASTPDHLRLDIQGDSVRWKDAPLGGWSVVVQGHPAAWQVDVQGLAFSTSLQAELTAGRDWQANLEGTHPGAGQCNVSLQASQGSSGWDMRLNEGAWTWPELSATAPTLALQGPLSWTASAQGIWPAQVGLSGTLGQVTLVPNSNGLGIQGTSGNDGLRLLDTSLGLSAEALSCVAQWSEGTLALDLSLDQARWKSIGLAKAEVAATWDNQQLRWSVQGLDSVQTPLLEARGTTSLRDPEQLRGRVTLNHAPAAWGQAWVPEDWLSFAGQVSGQVGVGGSISAPSLQGALALDAVRLTVPNMGTWFEVDGALRVKPDAWLVDHAQVRDAAGQQATWTAALYHDGFQEVNVDVHAFDMSGPMRILDLPKEVDLPFSGVLDADGEASMFFWNDQFTVSGDARIVGPSDCQISLVSEGEVRWEDLVTFVNPHAADSVRAVDVNRGAQGVTLSLDLDIDPSAVATLVTDRDNSVKMGGRTKGALSMVLEDWERLTLTGGLEIVEGECEFVLGPFLSKDFDLQPGGMLTWDGDPYAGQIDVEALHTLRANVTPLIGEINGQGRRMENVHVSLLLDGDMLQPDIDFALGAPDAENVVQSAMASVLVDDAERTAQAIALLSLQEFLPNQFNSLSLGTEGLQSNSVDMLTSQVSRWLSNLNDDVEIGLSYDAAGALLTEEESQQDALQLAMKAAFLDNRLHVEGEMGSNPTLESLGGANLQEVRVMYELNAEKGLHVVGFSENSPTQGQIGSQSTQGVGLRWHKSFNWIWPWQRPKTEDNQPKEEGSTSS